MLLRIPQVLNPEELAAVTRTLSQAAFVDGKLSAGMAAEQVKNNLELDREAPQRDPLAQVIVVALYRSTVFKNAVLPNRLSTPIFARYTPGMAYGDHVDDPVMGSGTRYRTDVSFTLFLSDPADYEGGELVVRTSWGEQSVKLAAGDAVIYPSGTRHRVAEVTGGERLVAVGWVQSLVRDPAKREILYDLSQARDRLLQTSAGTAECQQVDHAYINLVRMWSEI